MTQLGKLFTVRLIIIPMLAVWVALAGACQPPADVVQQNVPPAPPFNTTQVPSDLQIAPAPDLSPLAAAGDCPGLDSALTQISGSPDPLAQARQLQLTVKGDKIQVVLVLAQPDTSFLQDFDAELSGQAGTRAQALVPPGRLCALANSGKVLAITLPAPAEVQ